MHLFSFRYHFFFHRTRTLECDQTECGEVTVMHLGYLRYTHYIITINFYGLADIQQWCYVKDVIFYVSFIVQYLHLIQNYSLSNLLFAWIIYKAFQDIVTQELGNKRISLVVGGKK